jgi:DNA mismatch repair protein MutS
MTPLMRQYWDIKAAHQDKILLFRMGDFFEMFFEDASTAAPILGIALTSRNKKSADETPMCGMPHHSVAGPINKLLKAGLKVAICEQIEDPKTAKGIVKRAVTRVLTPGMVYDSETLDQSLSHYLACWEDGTLACVDTTTGESFYFSNLNLKELSRLLQVLPIAELVLKSREVDLPFQGLISEHLEIHPQLPMEKKAEPLSAQRLLSYIHYLGGLEALKTLKPFQIRTLHQRLDLSSTVMRHLELFATYRGEGPGSLFHAMNRTQTSAGTRLLRNWLSFPLTHLQEISQRQAQVGKWIQDPARLKAVRESLSKMGDIERRLGKISQSQCHGRDLLALSQSIEAGVKSLRILQDSQIKSGDSFSNLQKLESLSSKIQQTLVEEPPLQTKQGHLIRKGFSAELDELIDLSTNAHSKVAQMESEEKTKTGIQSLKIRYNNVFGYYIEITHTHKEKVPSRYLRKQTLANAERYFTAELEELEKKVLSSQSKRAELEFQIFEELRQECLNSAASLLSLASETSELDVLSSFAWLAIERKYCQPKFNEQRLLKLRASRHPVVEQTVKKSFVANDLELNSGGCLLLTGPNMAGKSTLMRQVALTVVMAQAGSYVPADQAELPIFDHLFTRIGASDQLSEGLSTFMVEMTETAEMLEQSTENSLLILDEIGRGTSTFDGMSLAQAILEFILEKKAALTLFATHYHELTLLETRYPQLRNGHMTVVEKNGEIRFLHTLKMGPAQKSYGIQVARLAGVPSEITARAQTLLKELEKQKISASSQLSLLEFAEADADTDAGTITMPHIPNVIQNLRQYPVMNKTPLEAMKSILEWQEALKDFPQTDTLS